MSKKRPVLIDNDDKIAAPPAVKKHSVCLGPKEGFLKWVTTHQPNRLTREDGWLAVDAATSSSPSSLISERSLELGIEASPYSGL